MEKTKVCLECKQILPLEAFHKQNKKYSHHHTVNKELIGKSYGQGRQPRCKECRKQHRKKYYTSESSRRYSLKSLYGISQEDYNRMLIEQNYKCFICKKDEKDCVKQRLYVDHCHSTGKVRKLLCSHCNSALGHSNENIQVLEKMIAYIKRHND